jgi:hypothetical protein
LNELLERLSAQSTTNYFRQPLPTDTVIMKSEASVIALAPERGFQRLYFVSTDAGDLSTLLTRVTGTEIVIEQVHRDDDALRGTFLSAGFEPLARYHRMWNRDMRSAPADEQFALATSADFEEIDALLAAAFDPRTDHLPALSELKEREAVIRRLGDRICGFVVFAISGAVANFNYLYSDCGDPTITLAMIETFYALARERGATRTFLWVDERKDGVIRLYERFGWRADGLRASYYRKPA